MQWRACSRGSRPRATSTARERWGPRVIDLDLLVYGVERCGSAALTLPHPGIPERSFVLRPWCEFAPDVAVPGMGRVAELAARLPADDLWVIDAAAH